MAISCTANDLAANSECYKKISQGDRDAVMIYLLNNISGLNLTPDQLISAAACYAERIEPHMQGAVIMYLLCQIVNK